MRNTFLNTSLFLIYIVTLLLYWTNLVPDLKDGLAIYVVSSVTLGVMGLAFYVEAAVERKFSWEDLIILGVFTLILLGHTYYTSTISLQALNILAVGYLYVVYPKVSIHTRWVYVAVFWGFILMSVCYIPEIRESIEKQTDEYAGFLAIFDSPNSVGTLGLIALASYFLLKEGRDQRPFRWLIAFLLIFLVILASHQRAALLMLLVWMLVYILIRMGMKRSWIYLSFLAILAIAGAYVIQTELSTNEELFGGYELFGKEASTRGRSEQISLALSSYDITAWGEGRGVVNEYIIDDTNYGVHNAFVITLLEYGYLLFAFYIFFLYWLFRKAKPVAAAFLLGYHVILFVESENFFSNHLLTFLAFSVVLIGGNDDEVETDIPEATDDAQTCTQEE